MRIRVAVVGTCASGKTSVSHALTEIGYDAYAVAQEHSGVADLWRHLEPDRLVFLENSLETLRQRRNDDVWPEWIYNTQRKRLTSARQNADVIISTDDLDLKTVVERIVESLGQVERSPDSR